MHLCAFTWGRSRDPGRAPAHRAQVGLETGSVDEEGRSCQVGRPHRGQASGAAASQAVLSASMSLPWLGDACGLVDAFRAKELSPLEALEACIDASEASPLNAFSHTDFDRAREAAMLGECDPAVRWRPVRSQGARTGRGLALHRSLSDLRGPGGGRGRHVGVPAAHCRSRAGRADDGARIRRDQLHFDRTARDHAEPVEPGRARQADRREALRPPWRAGCSPSPPAAMVVGPSEDRPDSPGSSGSRQRMAGFPRDRRPASNR